MVDSINGSSAADAALAAAFPAQAARSATSGSSGAAAAAVATAASSAANQPTVNAIDADVSSEIEQYLRASGHEMKFDIDGTTKQVVVKVYNSATGELVRQIPDAELLHLAQALRAGNHTLEASA